MKTQSLLKLCAALSGVFSNSGRTAALFGTSPSIQRRSTNKFTPHQGAREIKRRRARGW